MSTPARILIIEDNIPDIEILRFALDQHDEPYVLDVLNDGEAALHFVQEVADSPERPEPCVILLDLHLPKHNGLAVLDAIRQTPALDKINVVILTGGGTSPKDQSEIAARGALLRRKPSNLSEFGLLTREILDICRDALPA